MTSDHRQGTIGTPVDQNLILLELLSSQFSVYFGYWHYWSSGREVTQIFEQDKDQETLLFKRVTKSFKFNPKDNNSVCLIYYI